MTVKIPADVEREDRVLWNLTARQLLVLAVTGLVGYALWSATRLWVPAPVFLALATPVGVTVAVVVLGRRDGLPLDRLLLAALRQRLQPRHRVSAPEGVQQPPAWLAARATHHDSSTVSPQPLQLPAEGVTEAGVVDLGDEGLAAIAVASTVNFGLRTTGEQEALVAAFGRYLHSLTAPVQVLVRAERLDLVPQIAELHEQAACLPHPALEQAAREHADYLGELAESSDLLHRQVLLVLREPLHTTGGETTLRRAREHTPDRHALRQAAEARLVRRLSEADELLRPAGITLTPLDASRATGVLAAACNPDSLQAPSVERAGAEEVITTPADSDEDELDERSPS